MKEKSSEKIAMQVSVATIIGNALLTIFKLSAGILANSSAMISDAVHSASDVLSTFVVIIGVKISSKKADFDHQYGHERLECVSAIILATFLATVGIFIGYNGIVSAASGSGNFAVPGTLALVAAVISIIGKEIMFWYTRAAAKKTGYGVLMADAWHHRSDALSSVGSFIGILGAKLGFPIFDPIAAAVISLFILKAAYDIFSDAVGKMTDRACDADTVDKIVGITTKTEGVKGIKNLKTRIFADKIYVDMEIYIDGSLTLLLAHEIAEKVHDSIEAEIENIKHCMVHMEPVKE